MNRVVSLVKKKIEIPCVYLVGTNMNLSERLWKMPLILNIDCVYEAQIGTRRMPTFSLAIIKCYIRYK